MEQNKQNKMKRCGHFPLASLTWTENKHDATNTTSRISIFQSATKYSKTNMPLFGRE